MDELMAALRSLRPEGVGLAELVGVSRRLPSVAPTTLHRDRMPADADAFVGRSRELERLLQWLNEPGVIVMKGPAGVGKSRLAVAAVRRWQGDSYRPAWRVDLVGVHSAAEVVTAIARQLEVPLPAAQADVALGHALGARGEALILLDTFEHLDAESADLVATLARLAPLAVVLVTSRGGLEAARIFDVEPMADTEAADLMVRRAGERGIDVSEDESVLALARRLEGLPLAVELAAARLGVMAPGQVLARLDDRLRVLARGRSPLSAALDWSWDLLGEHERRALAELSVFRGGFDIEAAHDVLSVPEPLDVLDSLVERSLVAGRSPRLRLYDAIRAYAADRLDELGGVEQARQRHGQHFAALGSREALVAVWGRVPRRQRRDLANLDIACERAVARADGSVAVATALAASVVYDQEGPVSRAVTLLQSVVDFDVRRSSVLYTLGLSLQSTGQLDEARERGRQGLECATNATDRMAASVGLASTLIVSSLHDDARAMLAGALELAPRVQDDRASVVAQGLLGASLYLQGKPLDAIPHYEAALALARQVGSLRHEGVQLLNLGLAQLHLGQPDEALTYLQRGLDALREVGDRRGVARSLTLLSSVWDVLGQHEASVAALHEALAEQRECGDRAAEATTIAALANRAERRGDLDLARQHFELALALCAETGDRRGEGHTRGALGGVLAQQGRREEAYESLHLGIAIDREVGNLWGEALAHGNLGMLLGLDGRFDEARTALARGRGRADGRQSSARNRAAGRRDRGHCGPARTRPRQVRPGPRRSQPFLNVGRYERARQQTQSTR
jgi:predicted ATPase